jgi:hypothetical protein
MNEDVLRLRKACREAERRGVVRRTNKPDARQRDVSPSLYLSRHLSSRPHLAFGALLAIAMAPSALEAQSINRRRELSAYRLYSVWGHPGGWRQYGNGFSRKPCTYRHLIHDSKQDATVQRDNRRLQKLRTLRLRLMCECPNSRGSTMGALWNSWHRSPLQRLLGSRAHPGGSWVCGSQQN